MSDLVAQIDPGAPIGDLEYLEWRVAVLRGRTSEWMRTTWRGTNDSSVAHWLARYFRQRGYTSFPRDYRLPPEVCDGNA